MNTDLKRGRQESKKLAECWLVQQIFVRVFSFSWLLTGLLWRHILSIYSSYFSLILPHWTQHNQSCDCVLICSFYIYHRGEWCNSGGTDASHSALNYSIITKLLLQAKTWWHTGICYWLALRETASFMRHNMFTVISRQGTHQRSLFRSLCGKVYRFPLQSLKHAEHIDG